MTISTLLLAVCGVAGDAPLDVPPEVRAAQAERAALIADLAPSVVAIFGREGNGGGSGVLISADGWCVTNFHVTDGSGDFMKCGLNDGNVYDAVVCGTDPVGDVALVKLLGRDDFPHATLGDSDAVRPGDWCLAMGNPFLLAKYDFAPTVTLRHRLRHAPLPGAGRHVPGIHRLPADRRQREPRQLRRAAVRGGGVAAGQADRHQRADQRQAGPREQRGGLRHQRQSGAALPGPPAKRPGAGPRDAERHGADGLRRHGYVRPRRSRLGRGPAGGAGGGRTGGVRRPAGAERQPVQERPRHLPRRLGAAPDRSAGRRGPGSARPHPRAEPDHPICSASSPPNPARRRRRT